MRGERLRELRKKKNWTLLDLAERLGVAHSTVQSYEANKKTPTLANLEKLSEIFSVSADYLLGIVDDPEPQRVESNIFEYLKKDNLTYKDIKLDKEELEHINSFLELIARKKQEEK